MEDPIQTFGGLRVLVVFGRRGGLLLWVGEDFVMVLAAACPRLLRMPSGVAA